MKKMKLFEIFAVWDWKWECVCEDFCFKIILFANEKNSKYASQRFYHTIFLSWILLSEYFCMYVFMYIRILRFQKLLAFQQKT